MLMESRSLKFDNLRFWKWQPLQLSHRKDICMADELRTASNATDAVLV